LLVNPSGMLSHQGGVTRRPPAIRRVQVHQ